MYYARKAQLKLPRVRRIEVLEVVYEDDHVVVHRVAGAVDWPNDPARKQYRPTTDYDVAPFPAIPNRSRYSAYRMVFPRKFHTSYGRIDL